MAFQEILSLPLSQAVYSVLDVETTGLSANSARVIEVGIVKVKGSRVIDRFSSFVNPGVAIPYEITGLTGITDEHVADAPAFEEISEQIISFLENSIFVAHNVSFDLNFITAELGRCGIPVFQPVQLCTAKLARRLYPQLRSKSLGSVCKHLSVRNPAAHRALGDAEATARVLIKMLKEVKEKYQFATIDELNNFQFTSPKALQRRKVPRKFGRAFASLPDTPGIYYFLDKNDKVVYIGKAKSIRDRVQSYLSPSAAYKSKKVLRQAVTLKTESLNTEVLALLTEAELIKKLKPRLNTHLKRYLNKYFLKIAVTEKYPRPEITTSFQFDGNDYYGLFTTKQKAVAVLEIIDKSFLLRECTDKELERGHRCLLAEIERCLAPCTEMVEEMYASEVDKVREFMTGHHQEILNRLIARMQKYSEKQRYEEAGEMKTLIELILSQVHKSSLLQEPVNAAEVILEITETQSTKDYILLLEGKVFIKRYILDEKDEFERALEDYYNNALQLDFLPTREELEKLKILLNWCVKNRNKVKIYYLKDYDTIEKLYRDLSQFNTFVREERHVSFDISDLVKET